MTALSEAPRSSIDEPCNVHPTDYEAGRAGLAPTLLDVRCSATASTDWPPSVLVEALSQYPHETHRVAFEPGQRDYNADDCEPWPIDGTCGANTLSSRISSGDHAGEHTIAIDLDVPARLVPSSTPGHSHLYIDKPMTWQAYSALLKALADAEVIEPGYEAASQRRKHTTLRLPWMRKASRP